MGAHRTWTKAGLLVVAASTVLGSVAFASAWRADAAPSSLTGVTAAGAISADPYSVWIAQMNRDGICALITGCQSASGTGDDWVLSMLVDVPGIGLQTVPVPVRVVETVPFRSMTLKLTASGIIGSVDAEVDAVLTPQGTGATVALTIVKATTSGLAETFVPQFIERFEPAVQAQLATLNSERASAGIKVSLTLQKGARTTARVRVTAASLSQTVPRAAGVVRILVRNRVVCRSTLRASTATCAFPAPPRGTLVRAVVTGQFDNGYTVWNSAMARYRP